MQQCWGVFAVCVGAVLGFALSPAAADEAKPVRVLFVLGRRIKMSAVVLTLAAVPAFAESSAPAPQDPPASEAASLTLPTIEVPSNSKLPDSRFSQASAPALIILDQKRCRRSHRVKTRL